MSRRQSYVSLDARQHDTLLEFENFKKKFLLANKHITKLNSTLSARIEELNAQISTLYVENLRLRASEIALTSQLKKERENSRKILADTESATHTLIKQLGSIRKAFGVPHARSTTPEAQPLPRAKRPIPNPNASPPPNRLARTPAVSVLLEDEELNLSSPEDYDVHIGLESSPPRKMKTKSRTSSSSRLPVPLSKSPPPGVDVIQIDFDDDLEKTGKRRPTRRQSGLLTSLSITAVTADAVGSPLSPLGDSPLHKPVNEDELMPAEPGEEEVEAIVQSVMKRERKIKKEREPERGRERDADIRFEVPRPRERERKKHRVTEDLVDIAVGSKSKLKDVTNSQANRAALPPLDTTSDRERRLSPDSDVPSSATSLMSTSTRNFLTTPATTPGLSSKPPSQLPTPRSSSPLAPPPPPESDAVTTGRERRARKSVNYAEPKLNTKMRKPDPVPPPPTATSKRSSMSAGHDDPPPISSRSSSSNTADGDADTAPTGTMKRRKARSYVPPNDEEESEGAQADAEFGGHRTGMWGSVEGRRRSVHVSTTRRLDVGDDLRRHSMAV